MKMTYMKDDCEVRDFAKIAAKSFANNDKYITFTDSDIKAGCLFAMRSGLGNDCVVVFRLDEDFEPINYQQLVKQYGVENESNM